uniref:hypothetical protein n=1 Tax=Nocardia sp. CC201C TaxID=3044575 RepID=UPI0024A9C353
MADQFQRQPPPGRTATMARPPDRSSRTAALPAATVARLPSGLVHETVPGGRVHLSGAGTLTASIARLVALADFSTPSALFAAGLPRSRADLDTVAALRVSGVRSDAALTVAGTLAADSTLVRTSHRDDFDRADGSLGSNWATIGYGPGDTTVVPVVAGSRFRAGDGASSDSNQCAALYIAGQANGDDHAVRALAATAPNSLRSGIIVRAGQDFQHMVIAIVSTAFGATGIWTVIGGAFKRRVTAQTRSIQAGETVSFVAQGNTYRLIRDPDNTAVVLASWTDSAAEYPPGVDRRHGGMFAESEADFFGDYTYGTEWDD